MTDQPLRWIKDDSAIAIHEEEIAERGGLRGIRDWPLLRSTLAQWRNRGARGDHDIANLAAAYVFDFARNRPFLDGNKRTAWVLAEIFLLENGFELLASDYDSMITMLAVADGTMAEAELAIWFHTYMRPHRAD
jgi:death on curing protein